MEAAFLMAFQVYSVSKSTARRRERKPPEVEGLNPAVKEGIYRCERDVNLTKGF